MTTEAASIAELQFEALAERFPGSSMTALPGNLWLVTVPDVALPAGWNQTSTAVSFVVPVGFPSANPDCFFADLSLRLASGAMPTASNFQPIPGTNAQAMWFSWHVAGWNPVRDTLTTYVHVIRDRLQRPN